MAEGRRDWRECLQPVNGLVKEAAECVRLDHRAQRRGLVRGLEDKKVSKLPATVLTYDLFGEKSTPTRARCQKRW
jgi:hypothetical protein